MPKITVTSNQTADLDSKVTLHESVEPEHLASEHHAAQLIEGVGWAVTDAKDAESTQPPGGRAG
jgi:hypothetical protein